MYNQNIRLRAKWLSATLMLICLMLLAGQDAYAKEYKLGDIPLHPEAYKKHLKVWPMEMLEMLPTVYDARDDGIFTPAKDQGSCGSCWAFASVGAMESHMLKAYGAGPKDLSEQQQVSCNTIMAGCEGGNSSAIKYWELRGPLEEACFQYTADDSTLCVESGCTQIGYRVIDWHTVPENTNDFKNSLYTYGPSYWRFNVYSDFDTFWGGNQPGQVYTSQSGASYRGGHAVLLIGWDDIKGAYLCKNSWGGGGPNGDGTFWIAYSGHYYDLDFGMANFSLTSLTCSSNADCDDGLYCNGSETCVNGACQDGVPRCEDDGLFCNGSETCNEGTQECAATGNPCGADTECNEVGGSYSCCDEDSTCEESEDCTSCSSDCISGTEIGGDCTTCFKGACDGICHPKKDGKNCPDCAASFCCGDGVCEGGENSVNCAIDCGSAPTCGDGYCDPGEDCICNEDCEEAPSEVNACSDGVDNDCDGAADCGDSDCDSDPTCICAEKKSLCTVNSDCCSNRCFRGACK